MKTNCLGMILTRVLNLGITIIFKAMDLSFMANKIVQSYILSSIV